MKNLHKRYSDRINRNIKIILPGPTINITQQGYNRLRDQLDRSVGSYSERVSRRIEAILPGPTVNITQQGYNQILDRVERELEV